MKLCNFIRISNNFKWVIDYGMKIDYDRIKIFEGRDSGDGRIMACFKVLI